MARKSRTLRAQPATLHLACWRYPSHVWGPAAEPPGLENVGARGQWFKLRFVWALTGGSITPFPRQYAPTPVITCCCAQMAVKIKSRRQRKKGVPGLPYLGRHEGSKGHTMAAAGQQQQPHRQRGG